MSMAKLKSPLVANQQSPPQEIRRSGVLGEESAPVFEAPM